jgi:hypothetical protein
VAEGGLKDKFSNLSYQVAVDMAGANFTDRSLKQLPQQVYLSCIILFNCAGTKYRARFIEQKNNNFIR